MTRSKSDRKDTTNAIDRRGFLRTVGVGAGAAGVAAVVGGSAAPTTAKAAAPASSGYRETEHVRRFYELARF